MTRTPVALLVFNRPKLAARIARIVAGAKPPCVYVIGDGPRAHVPGDAQRVAETRSAIDAIDWPCPVIRDYAPANLGCGRRVASGITRVFAEVEEAIFVEDDVLPDPSFFGFCDELLARYRDDDRVGMVSGTNALLRWKDDVQDYHFTTLGSVWGWASWRRAWRHYDFAARSFEDPAVRARVAALIDNAEQLAYRLDVTRQVHDGEVDTWDYQWSWAQAAGARLTAVSAVNLVSNLGFGADATHTLHYNLVKANLPRFAAPPALRAPEVVRADRDFDREMFDREKGRASLDRVIAEARALLSAGRAIHALIVVDRFKALGNTAAELDILRAEALLHLDRRAPAAASIDAVLAREPDNAAALALRRRIAGNDEPASPPHA